MVAMLAFGGTYAYFTATADKATSEKVTVAKIAIKGADVALTLAQTKTNVLPGDEVTMAATITNESNRSIYLFVAFNVNLPEGTSATDVSLDLTPADWTEYKETGVYYTTVTATGEQTFNAAGTFEATDTSNEGEIDGTIMGQDITVSVRFAATQSENITIPDGSPTGTTEVDIAYGLISDKLSLTA